MVSIALRAYNNDIGDLIDHQQIEESISHCRHILETYPKHVDTYRLLGKAYLEEKRYGDASDILQRVLSSVPEDFIAHVGMSIIREDEGNLDAAIYHMERAFETQPSNHAIHDELRRLQAIRDGIEPPRIRLTRGALARMYAHGHLYDQAIAELLAAISEDAQRFDLQTLLAEMYYQNEKKVDAAETCTKILEKLPYCLKANQLLTIILEENDRAEDAQRYRQRWEALDPYAAFTEPNNTNPDRVPDTRIKIDRLEWEPDSFLDAQDDQPVWAASLGVSLAKDGGSDEEIPEWLTEEIAAEEGDLPGFDLKEDELVDDFFNSDESPDSPIFDDEETDPAPEDWLRDSDEKDDFGLFADETRESEPEKQEDKDFDFLVEDSADDDDDWMSEFVIPDQSGTSAGEDETLDLKEDQLGSLDSSDEEQFSVPEEERDQDDDWLASLGTTVTEAPSAPESEIVGEDEDWIASLGAGQETPEEDEEDDWLASLGTTDSEEPSVPEPEKDEEEEDWIASLGAGQETPEEDEEDDWLASLGTTDTEEPSVPEPEKDEEEKDWIASLGAGQDTPDEEVKAEEDDWLASIGTTDSEEPSAPEPEIDEEEKDWIASLGARQETPDDEIALPEFLKEAGWEKSTSEMDDSGDVAFDSDEELSEELEQAEIPDWIRDMAPPEDVQPSSPTSEFSAEADPEWLDELGQPPDTPAPDWLSELDETSPEIEEEAETKETVTGKEIQATDLDMAWLESLAAKQGIPDEELVTSPEQRAGVSEHHIPEGMEPDQEIPVDETEDDWHSELDVQPEEVKSVLEEEDDFDMDWLDEIGQQAAEEAAATTIEAAPAEEVEAEVDWLADLGEKEAEAEDDWLSELDAQSEIGTPPAEEAQPEEVKSVLEEEDDFDMDWLDEIGQQAAEEAAATTIEAAPAEEVEAEVDWLADLGEKEAEAEDDWLSELDAQSEIGTPPAEEAQPEEVKSVLEEEDDFDMDWLDEIGQQAAEEAAATTIEAAPAEEVEAEVDWLADLGEKEAEAEDDWLSELDAQSEIGTPPAQEAQPEEVKSVLEEEDDFDMDWLDEIGQQAAEEAAATTIEAAPAEEVEAEVDWLADLGEKEAEAEDDWLSELDAQSETGTPPAEEAQPEEVKSVLEEEDDFDMDWLDEIGQQAAEEAAATTIEAAPPEDVEVEDQPGELTSAWLATVGSEYESGTPPDDDTTGRFLSDFEDAQIDEDDSGVTDFLTDLDQVETEPERESAPEGFEPVVEDTEAEYDQDEFDEPELQPQEEVQPVLDERIEFEEDAESTSGDIEMDEQQGFQDSDLLQAEQPAEEIPETADLAPTQTDEWQIESHLDAPDQAEPLPIPETAEAQAALDPDSAEGILEAARAAADKGKLDEAIKGFNKLIGKGKLVNEVISEVTEALRRHPVNVQLWQVLGDAYLRVDNLQEALDAYTNAEELLR